MRTIGIILACGLFLAACSGGAASPSAEAPSAAPSVAASEAPSEAPPSVEPSVAASVEPSASATAEGCMDAKAYALLKDTKVDWSTVSAEDRELVASALESYEFAEGEGFSPEYVTAFTALLRTGAKVGQDMQPFGLWTGQIVIVSCG